MHVRVGSQPFEQTRLVGVADQQGRPGEAHHGDDCGPDIGHQLKMIRALSAHRVAGAGEANLKEPSNMSSLNHKDVGLRQRTEVLRGFHDRSLLKAPAPLL